MTSQQDPVNYRRVAAVGLTAALLDAIERTHDPNAMEVHMLEGVSIVEAKSGPVARRLFEVAYALAPEHPQFRKLWPWVAGPHPAEADQGDRPL